MQGRVGSGWVGLDVGTTSSKAVVYDEHGQELASGRSRTVWESHRDGVQIEVGHLLSGAVDALDAAMESLPAEIRVAGLGITSMGETGVLVDGRGRPVAPAIAWHDGRDGAEVQRLRDQFGEDLFGARAGKPLRGQFSLTKHRWLVDHVPSVASAVRRFNVAEWIARGLGADEACDRALACRTGWFDIAAGDWWEDALAWSGARAELMPPLVRSGTPIGTVGGDRAHPRLAGAVITLAGHDHQAAAVGVGAARPGDELDSSGTAEALVRTIEPTLAPDQLAALARAGITTDESVQPGLWSLLGGTEGGLAMQRTLGLLGVSTSGLAALDELALATTASGVRVSGIGSDALAVGGITDRVGPGEVWRAVVESATAQAVTLHEEMTAIAGPHTTLVAAGGWCHSAMVMHAKRAGFGDLTVTDVAEAGTLGAAILAARATGHLEPHDAGFAR